MSKEPKRNVYVGHRYVPKIMGEWDKTESYEGLSIVTNEGTSYTSKKRVPIGIDIKNEEYWVVTGNYNAQVEHYRKEVVDMKEEVNSKANKEDLNSTNKKISQVVKNAGNYDIVGDGITDDSTALQNTFNEAIATGGRVVLPKNQNYTIKKELYIHDKVEIDLNNSTINVDGCDGIIITADYKKAPKIKNGIIKSKGGKDYRGIVIDKQIDVWGAKGLLENIIVDGFNIGIQTVISYQSIFKDVLVERCNIGVHITQTNFFSNAIKFDNLTILTCKYGLYLDYAVNLVSVTTTIEYSDYAIVISDKAQNIKFDSTWFEANKIANVEFGKINVSTMVLTTYTTTKYGFIQRGIEFTNTRFSAHDGGGNVYPKTLFPERHKFMAKYGSFNNSYRYKNDIESFLTSGIEYRNIANSNTIDVSPPANSTVVTETTPFGNKKVVKGLGVHGNNLRITTFSKSTRFNEGDVLLMKVKIKANKDTLASMRMLDSDGYDISTYSIGAERFRLVRDGWIEVAEIVKINKPITTYDVFGTCFIDDGGSTVTFKATDFSIINLTEIFGKGEEPEAYLNKEIARFFPYTDFLIPAKTGYGGLYFPKGETDDRPTNPTTGYQYFDTILGRPIWWNSVKWLEHVGMFRNIPESSTSSGNKGDFSASENFIYICYDTNKWIRVQKDEW